MYKRCILTKMMDDFESQIQNIDCQSEDCIFMKNNKYYQIKINNNGLFEYHQITTRISGYIDFM